MRMDALGVKKRAGSRQKPSVKYRKSFTKSPSYKDVYACIGSKYMYHRHKHILPCVYTELVSHNHIDIKGAIKTVFY